MKEIGQNKIPNTLSQFLIKQLNI